MSMNSFSSAHGQEYARLPEDLLAELLAAAPRIADQVNILLGPAMQQRDALRREALQLGRIGQVATGNSGTLCAIDGGFAVERTVAVDIALSVAVGIEGFSPPGMSCAWNTNQYSFAYDVLTHDLENERLARGSMIIQELDILADAPHAFRIYDGSHLTPIIQLNSALVSRSEAVSNTTVQLANDRDTRGAFASFVTESSIIGMPKYDSSRELCDLLGTHIAERVPGDDKYLCSLILRGGEYTTPSRVYGPHWSQLHIDGNPGVADADSLARDLDDTLQALRDRNLYSMYFRPTDSGPAYRIEIKPALANDTSLLNDLLATLGRQITGPFVREPYPQYLADVMAKSVGFGLSALQTAAQLTLSRTSPELAQVILHSYRTEGK